MTEKLSNHVSAVLDDDLYEFVKVAAASEGVDVSTYIRKAIMNLRDSELSRYSLFNGVFSGKINNI